MRLLPRHDPKGLQAGRPHLPRRYVSNQVILYSKSLIDEALYAASSPEEAIVGICRQGGTGRDTGVAESIRKALNKG
jgi:hypothetical protein